MPVNFLPVSAWNEGSNSADSVENSPVCGSCDDDIQTQSKDRTSRWVADLDADSDVTRKESIGVDQSDVTGDTMVECDTEMDRVFTTCFV